MNEELPALVASNFPVDTRLQSIFGHSMGGHGALTIAMKVPFFDIFCIFGPGEAGG